MAPSKSTDREAREARERLRRYTARQTVHNRRVARRTRDNRLAIAGVLVVAAVAAAVQIFYFVGGPGTPTPTPTPSAAADSPTTEPETAVPDPSVAEGRTWTGTLTVNDIPLGIELDGAAAPQAVASVVTSAADGFYLGKTCHRLVSSETAGLLQCGSLDGTGAGDPAYSYGPVENAPTDGTYPAGSIAMARASGDANSFGRQFFLVYSDSVIPDDAAGGYTVVGRVTTGLDALIAGVTSAGIADGAVDGAPVIPTVITGFTIQ